MTRGEEMAKQLVHERVIGETRYQYKRKLVQMGRQIIADTFGAEYINDEGFPVLPLATACTTCKIFLWSDQQIQVRQRNQNSCGASCGCI